MAKEVIAVPALGPSVGPFARAVRSGRTIYVSGTSALSHLGGDLERRALPAGIEAQTRQTLENLAAVLEAAGGSLRDIVKVTVMLKNAVDYRAMNAVRAEYFRDASVASTTFVADLVRDDMLIEVDAVAVLE